MARMARRGRHSLDTVPYKLMEESIIFFELDTAEILILGCNHKRL